MFYLIFIGIERLFRKTKRNKIDMIVILSIFSIFGVFYFFMPNKAKQYRKETLLHIELLESKIRNDPRFERVDFFDSDMGALAVIGRVRNQEDHDALKEVVSPYKSQVEAEWWFVAIDRPDFIEHHGQRQLLVYIGSIEMNNREYVADLLNKYSIYNHIQDSAFLVEGSKVCYIYVSSDKKEMAIDLLKQISSFKP